MENKVDVIVNVYGKPWQTLCTLKSLLKQSGNWIDRIFLIKENKQPYEENIDWIYSYFSNLTVFTPNKYVDTFYIIKYCDYYLSSRRYRIRYQYGIEKSGKRFVFISHNDVLYTGDVVGEMLFQIEGCAGIGEIGQCWNCPAQNKGVCCGEKFYEWNPSYEEVLNLGLPYKRTSVERIDRKNPKPLPECRLNEWACLINREIVMKESYPRGNSPLFGQPGLDIGDLWFRSFHLKGYRFRYYKKHYLHSYWSSQAGYLTELDRELYEDSERRAKEYFQENFT